MNPTEQAHDIINYPINKSNDDILRYSPMYHTAQMFELSTMQLSHYNCDKQKCHFMQLSKMNPNSSYASN